MDRRVCAGAPGDEISCETCDIFVPCAPGTTTDCRHEHSHYWPSHHTCTYNRSASRLFVRTASLDLEEHTCGLLKEEVQTHAINTSVQVPLLLFIVLCCVDRNLNLKVEVFSVVFARKGNY